MNKSDSADLVLRNGRIYTVEPASPWAETVAIRAGKLVFVGADEGVNCVTGSIAVGKSADMIILDRNLFEIDTSDIADTKVLATYFEGRPVFERQ